MKILSFIIVYKCESCNGCEYCEQCCKGNGDRTVRLNQELTDFHEEVIANLECAHGALLRMNRSIQAEGAFGIMKWNRDYRRVYRRGIKAVIMEYGLICCGFNLYKYHLKRLTKEQAA